jgi:hypothetical protein
VGNYELAVVETGLGNRNEALVILQEALREKEPAVAFMIVDPRLSSLRAIPKFTGLLRRIVLVGEAHGQGAGL